MSISASDGRLLMRFFTPSMQNTYQLSAFGLHKGLFTLCDCIEAAARLRLETCSHGHMRKQSLVGKQLRLGVYAVRFRQFAYYAAWVARGKYAARYIARNNGSCAYDRSCAYRYSAAYRYVACYPAIVAYRYRFGIFLVGEYAVRTAVHFAFIGEQWVYRGDDAYAAPDKCIVAYRYRRAIQHRQIKIGIAALAEMRIVAVVEEYGTLQICTVAVGQQFREDISASSTL